MRQQCNLRVALPRRVNRLVGMEDVSKIPNLVSGLMERGFSDEDILKILSGNTLRVMKEVERSAGKSN